MKLSYFIGTIIFVTAGALFGINAEIKKLNEPMHMDMSRHASSTAPMTATIRYTEKGFVPQMVTIKEGGTVTFESTDGNDFWVASGDHADHAQYSGTGEVSHCPDLTGTAFDQCGVGKTFLFTFQKIGEWDFHNHLKEENTGMVMVVR